MRLGAAFVFGVALAACGEPRPLESSSGAGGECASCHSAPGEAPPFRSVRGTPGAHDPHLAGQVGPALACAECHTVPAKPEDPGHFDDSPSDVVFGELARTGGASPTWNGVGCAASYCHGNFPGGSTANVPIWQSPRSASCGTCHGLPPTTGRHAVHVNEGIACPACHGTVTVATHVNGRKDVPLTAWNASLRSCAQACHGSRSW